MIQNVLIYANSLRDVGYTYTQEVIRFLLQHGITVYVAEPNQDLLGAADNLHSDREIDKSQLDLAIVLGGDGTMILAVHYLLGSNVPIIGVNLGHLGYMTEIEPDDFETPLAELLAGRYKVEQRMMMEAQVHHEGKEPDHTYYAVNDFVIHRDLLDSLLHVQAYVNKEYLAEFRSDGVIVSSPCGSTAYNFSAGGPILSPVADNLILTPLCSHAMLDRSVVLRGDDELSFYLGSYTRADHAAFSIDGSQTIFVGERSWITIRKSQHYFPLAKVGKRSFYEIVQKKMRP